MTINPSQISTIPLSQTTNFAIEIFYTDPPLDGVLSTQRVPGQLLGFYNNNSDELTLYVVDTQGTRLVRVRG